MSLVWRYTTFFRLRMILAEGFIGSPKYYYVGAKGPGTVRMVVLRPESQVTWFSANPEWEETANLAFITNGWTDDATGIDWFTKEFTSRHILSRIAVANETAPYDFEDYRRRESADITEPLHKWGLERGANPSEWRFCLGPSVPREKWLAVEIWHGEKWVPYDPDLARRKALAKHLGISVDGVSIGPGLSVLCAGMTSVWTYYVQVDGWDGEYVFEEPPGPERAEVAQVEVDGIPFLIRQGKPPLRVSELWPDLGDGRLASQ